jgi:DNA-binding response OmpR family regulator
MFMSYANALAEGPPPETCQRPRVLVVDDHSDAARLLARLLENAGFSAREAHTGADAIRIFGEFQPHAVLLDLGMPEMNGFEVCRQIRLMPKSAGVLIVIISGYLQDEDKIRAMDAGANYYFVKPANPSKLLTLIEQYARDLG